MKSLRFLPITFVAGVQGFVIFASYAALVLVGGFIFWRRSAWRRRQDQLIAVTEPLSVASPAVAAGV